MSQRIQFCSSAAKNALRATILAAVGIGAAMAQITGTPGPIGMPGCTVNPASPATGTGIPESYFGVAPSTVNKSLVGPLQLLTAGRVDERAGTIRLPLYRGRVKQGNRAVWYILTDTTDRANAEALGLNFSAKLVYSAVSPRAVRNATLLPDGSLEFESGTVDFTPDRILRPIPGPNPFPPLEAKPGSVGDASYSPLIRIVNAGGHIYNEIGRAHV